MRALWDFPVLPYSAVAPWPLVINNGYPDWIESSYLVESWLENNIGPHYRDWTWNMWTLHNSNLCGVSFSREKYCTLFLLRFGE